MLIESTQAAEYHAKKSLSHFKGEIKTLVVGQDGDVHANCDVDEVVKQHKQGKKKYFVLKGKEPKNTTE